MNNYLIVCTSNVSRSRALEKYLSEKYPNRNFRSAGINKYLTGRKGTHYITKEDVEWADILVFAEDVHYERAAEITGIELVMSKKSITLGLGDYDESNMQEYCVQAEVLIKKSLAIFASLHRRTFFEIWGRIGFDRENE